MLHFIGMTSTSGCSMEKGRLFNRQLLQYNSIGNQSDELIMIQFLVESCCKQWLGIHWLPWYNARFLIFSFQYSLTSKKTPKCYIYFYQSSLFDLGFSVSLFCRNWLHFYVKIQVCGSTFPSKKEQNSWLKQTHEWTQTVWTSQIYGLSDFSVVSKKP